MANIVINDLPVNSTLDTQALASIVGGTYYPYDVTSIHSQKYFNATSFQYQNVTAYENSDFYKAVGGYYPGPYVPYKW